MSAYVIPIFIIIIMFYTLIKKQNPYTTFVYGAKTSFDLILSIFPYILAIFIMIELFSISGISDWFCSVSEPFFKVFGIPKELSELIILKNFTGSGSIAILENIFSTYGVDSYISRCACCIAGCSDAVFYVSAVYFSKTNVTKFGYAIPVAIVTNFITAVICCFMCKFFNFL